MNCASLALVSQGFSHGLNCAESSNFATADWLRWGRASVAAFRTTPNTRRPCFTHEMLLLTLARKVLLLSPHTAMWLRPELVIMIEEEEQAHSALRLGGLGREICFEQDPSAPEMGRALMKKGMAHDKACAKAAGTAEGKKGGEGKRRHGVGEGEGCSEAGGAGEPAGRGDAGCDPPSGSAEVTDVGPTAPCPNCAVCEYECYLSVVECTLADGNRCFLCPMHALESDHAGVTAAPERKALLVFREPQWMRSLLATVTVRAEGSSGWVERAQRVLHPEEAVRATLSEATAVLDAGVQLGMDDEHMLKLTSCSKAAATAVAKAQSFLSAGTRSKRASLAQCVECLAQVDGLPLAMPVIDQLRELTIQATSWESEVEAALQRPSVGTLEVRCHPNCTGVLAYGCRGCRGV